MLNIQGLVEKLRALVVGEGDVSKLIRNKVEENYQTKRAPKYRQEKNKQQK